MSYSTLYLKMDINFPEIFELHSTKHKHLDTVELQFVAISIW